jgi:hypothetical protein
VIFVKCFAPGVIRLLAVVPGVSVRTVQCGYRPQTPFVGGTDLRCLCLHQPSFQALLDSQSGAID